MTLAHAFCLFHLFLLCCIYELVDGALPYGCLNTIDVLVDFRLGS